MNTTIRDLLCLVYHEAGHLALAKLLGVSAVAISLDATNRRGSVTYFTPSGGDRCSTARDSMKIAAAGPIAEWRYSHPTVQSRPEKIGLEIAADPKVCPAGWIDDAGNLHETAWKIVGLTATVETAGHEVAEAWGAATELLDRNWSAVERIVQQLLTFHDEIDSIFQP